MLERFKSGVVRYIKGPQVAAPQPATILNDLVGRLRALQMQNVVDVMELKRLSTAAAPLKQIEAHSYYMFSGMVGSVAGRDKDLIDNFERALKLRDTSSIVINYMTALNFANMTEELSALCQRYLARFRDDLEFQESLFLFLIQAGALITAGKLALDWLSGAEAPNLEEAREKGAKVYWGTARPTLATKIVRLQEFLDWEQLTGITEAEVVSAIGTFRKGVGRAHFGFHWRSSYVMSDQVPSLSYAVTTIGTHEFAAEAEARGFEAVARQDNAAIENGWLILGVDVADANTAAKITA